MDFTHVIAFVLTTVILNNFLMTEYIKEQVGERLLNCTNMSNSEISELLIVALHSIVLFVIIASSYSKGISNIIPKNLNYMKVNK